MDNPDTLQIPQCTCGRQRLPGRYLEPVCWQCDRLTTRCDVCGEAVTAENIGAARWRYTCDTCFTDASFYKRKREQARKAQENKA